MRTDIPHAVRLADYRPPDYLIDRVHLDIALHPSRTEVRAVLEMRPNPKVASAGPLLLDGDGLAFVRAALDGAELGADAFIAKPEAFTLHAPPSRAFELVLETVLDPSSNTQLMGLYRSSSCYCTQCEAEGFRRITYFLDRPDVLAVYTTRIVAHEAEAPVLLSNGNLVDSGGIGEGRHFAVWHDPFPKPAYLFALVGGDLACVADRFKTASGRDVALKIYVEHGKESKCGYAMDALKRAMRWDEEVFGLEYDLDVFMIVAVSDFNMGAMENKGLNIFNDKYVLALPETATDQDYANIEAIVAHEYFHNWTGNRITCRDWFQLCLKEGLTVFRDQEFSSDQRSRAVKRISDVRILRSQQFAEDAGPLAHSVRPEIYHEINNFYTATVYEKGAEVIRMLKRIIGEDAFRRGIDLYISRHDGEAATIEQFIACFAESSATDLTQFMLWYSQSGTPDLHAAGTWDRIERTYRLDLVQSLPPTPGQPTKEPMVIPVAVGLVGAEGDLKASLDGEPFDGVVRLAEKRRSFLFSDVGERPVLSLLRGFSAPVKLSVDIDEDGLLTLLRRDSDPFNRWEAAQTFATRLIVKRIRTAAAEADERFLTAIRELLTDERLDPAFAALTLTLPTEADIAREIGLNVDPAAVFEARRTLRRHIGNTFETELAALRERTRSRSTYTPDAASAGRRSLRNVALDLACASGSPAAGAMAREQFASADNMTDRIAALAALCLIGGAPREEALSSFRDRYSDDPLVLDKWLALQAQIPEAGTLDRVKRLMDDPHFSRLNPNRVRALIGAFASGNQTQFNRPDGKGYRFVAELAAEIDRHNPQLAARILGSFKSWQALEGGRRSLAASVLRRLNGRTGLSRDVADIVRRAIA
jgi:aminopeptidase N